MWDFLQTVSSTSKCWGKKTGVYRVTGSVVNEKSLKKHNNQMQCLYSPAVNDMFRTTGDICIWIGH